MSLSDLFFIFLFLATLCAILATLVALLQRRWRAARNLAASICIVWVAYLAIGTLVAVATPQRILTPVQPVCFDEYCFQVVDTQRTTIWQSGDRTVTTSGVFYLVTVRVFSKSRGRPQRENGATAWLVDSNQHRYLLTAGHLDPLLYPGQSVTVQLIFEVPATLHNPGLVIGHDSRLNPGTIIIGDDRHFLHRPTAIQLDK